MDLELLPASKKERADTRQIFISHFKPKNFVCGCVSYRTVIRNRKGQIVGRFFFLIEFKVVFIISKYNQIIWVGSGSAWIRNFCLIPDPELENSKLDPDMELIILDSHRCI